MTEKAHAILSASGAEKWLNCTPSARLEETIPDKETSYSKEGTLAHSVAELSIRYHVLKSITKKEFTSQLEKLKSDALYSPEILDHVNSFTSFVEASFNAALEKNSDARMEVEARLDFSKYVPEGFGTGDVIIASDDTMHVIDFKYGAGIPVNAKDNSQLKLYALGGLQFYELLYDIKNVKTTIFQPRLDSISEAAYSAAELLEWGENFVAPRAKLAFKGEGEFISGSYCKSHFCKAAHTCRARHEKNIEMAKYDFAAPPLLSDEEMAAILLNAKEFETWIKDIQAYALSEAVKGKKWPDFKLVEGRSTRKYSQEQAVMEFLADEGFEPDKFAPRSLLGITEMEKLITKKRFAKLLTEKGFVIKPPGKPALVPLSDPRPEFVLAGAAEDFNDNFDYSKYN